MKRQTCNFLKLALIVVISLATIYLLTIAVKWEIAEANGFQTITKDGCAVLYTIIVAGFAAIFALISKSCANVTCKCGKKEKIFFNDCELDCGGKNHICEECRRLYWIGKDGNAAYLGKVPSK